MEVDILAFAPHPDDAELGAGGTLARHAAVGYRVGVIDLTRGEMANNGTPEERLKEASEAAKILGLAIRDNLGLPDLGLQVSREQVDRLVEAIRRYRPAVVLAPYWADHHPDHRATAHLVDRACFLSGLFRYPSPGVPHRPRRLVYYFVGALPVEPSFIVDVTSHYSLKTASLLAHRSQFAPPGTPLEEGGVTRPGPLNAPGFLHLIESRDRYLGSLVGGIFGEGFYTRDRISVDDLFDL